MLPVHRVAALTVVTVALVCVVGAASRPAHALSPPRPPGVIVSTNVPRMAILHFQLDTEVLLGRRLGVFVAPIVFHHAHWYPFAASDEHTATGGGVDLGVRYYFAGQSPSGWYASPILSAYLGDVTTDGESSLSGFVFSAGAQAGYTWLRGHWVFSGALGGSYGVATEEAAAGSPRAAQLPHRGPWINFRANVGLVW